MGTAGSHAIAVAIAFVVITAGHQKAWRYIPSPMVRAATDFRRPRDYVTILDRQLTELKPVLDVGLSWSDDGRTVQVARWRRRYSEETYMDVSTCPAGWRLLRPRTLVLSNAVHVTPYT
jgi:hypothetical protein